MTSARIAGYAKYALPSRLYLRSRALPSTLAAFAVAAATAAYLTQPQGGPQKRELALVLAPLLVSAAIGAGLRSHSPDLDRTSARPWWPLRTAHLAGCTALAALTALVVPVFAGAHAAYGADGGHEAEAIVRNVLGLTGLAALTAVLLGARLSWLPALLYALPAYLAADGTVTHGLPALWTWLMQDGSQPSGWWVTCGLFAAGSALFAWRGPRPEGGES